MNQKFSIVPFKASSENGIVEYNGIAKFSSAGVVVEFEKKFLGLVPGGVQELRISIGEILDVVFKKRFMLRSGKIELRTVNFTLQSQLPNNDGKLVLKIKKEDVERAKDAVEKLQKDIVDLRATLPPTETRVGHLFAENDAEDETKRLK